MNFGNAFDLNLLIELRSVSQMWYSFCMDTVARIHLLTKAVFEYMVTKTRKSFKYLDRELDIL